MYLFICVIKGGKLQKTLEEHKLWEPRALVVFDGHNSVYRLPNSDPSIRIP